MDLDLPRRIKPGRLSFNTSAPAVQAWVDDLPLLNTDKTLAMVSSALDQINTLDIPPQQRHETLELLSTSVMCITDALRKAFLGKQLPLQENSLQQAIQVIELCNRMACGYRIVVDDAGSIDAQRRLLGTAIHRAIRYLSEVMLTNYQIYVQYPAGLWGIIHALFGLAEELRLSTQLFTDNTLHTTSSSSIETIYKQGLLLSLACPYRLRQNEIHYVYNGLLDWARASRLYQASKTQKLGLFAVNLRADLPPAYRALREDLQTNGNWRILDTSEMAHRMQQAISGKARSTGRATGLGDAQTMQRLMLAWGVMPKRKFSRYRKDASIRLVMGMNAIHRLAGTPAVEKEDVQNGIAETIRDHQYLQDPTFERATRVNLSDGREIGAVQGSGTSDQLLRGAYSASGSGTNPVEVWKMENISAGGFCLLWDSESASCAQVGELVAILSHEENDNDTRQLGVIRWMKFTPAHGLELGIQLLSPGAMAVWAYICEDDPRPSNKLQGVLLPEIKALRQPASLLLPSLPFRVGCISTLQYQGTTEAIILTRQIENTGAFAQYNFTPAEQATRSDV
ncbi:MAG TPA: hypothetical protein VET88_11245 [Gammaproteobacteria bacterium]|nr:hypothetical protein [Gammaproteobacteria bacterium]